VFPHPIEALIHLGIIADVIVQAGAPHQVYQVFVKGVGEPVGQTVGGKAHEVARFYFDGVIAKFCQASPRQNIDKLLFGMVAMVLGGVIAGGQTHQMDAQVNAAHRIPEGFAVADCSRIEGMDEHLLR
jgi:hypothetical protein